MRQVKYQGEETGVISKMKVRFLEVWRQSNVVKGVLILEGLLLLVLLANCFRARCDRAYGCGDLYMDSDVVQVAVSEDGTEYYLADLDDNITETTILHTDYFSLWPGAYRAIIDYTSQVNYEEESNYQNGNGYFYLTTVDDSIYTRFDTLFLRNGTTSLEQTIRVTSPWKLSGLQMSVSYYGLGELAVSSLEVREIPAFRYLLFFTAILLFVIFDLVAYVLLLDRNFHYEKEVGILTLVCLAAILPFIADYAYAGHDIDFHLQRILFLAEELRNGNYFPAILSQALNGYGYAVPLHYGQIFLYIPAFLYNCGVSLRVAYNIYICLLSIATCLVMYYCALKIFKKTSTALLASALYTLSAVRLSNIFTRAALGEFTAQTFYPLIFLGFYNIYTAPKNEKITIRKYWPIIVERGMTPIIASHNLRELEDICEYVGLLHRGGVLLEKDLDEMKVNIHKVQCVLRKAEDIDVVKEHFAVLNENTRGNLKTITLRGERPEVEALFAGLDPVFYELLPLSLEEIFISETEVKGYDVKTLFG